MSGNTRDPVGRAFDVLLHIVEQCTGPTSARRLAADMDMPTTTVQRALTTLAGAGMLTSDPVTQLYGPGPGLHRLARMATGKHPLGDIAMPYLHELSASTGETSHVGQYEASSHQMMFIAQVPGTRPLRYVVPMHAWVPLYLGASGLAILAFTDESAQDTVVKLAQTEARLDPEALREQLTEIRARGYALTHGQRLAGAVGIAAPVRGVDDQVVGDVVLTVPEVQFQEERGDEYGELVRTCATNISRSLGATVEPGRRQEFQPIEEIST